MDYQFALLQFAELLKIGSQSLAAIVFTEPFVA